MGKDSAERVSKPKLAMRKDVFAAKNGNPIDVKLVMLIEMCLVGPILKIWVFTKL